jgi:hypothetical protein
MLPDDGDEDINGHRNPNLDLYCILTGTVERLDAQMLLDPFEEQLDLPATLVDLSDHKCRKGEVVG